MCHKIKQTRVHNHGHIKMKRIDFMCILRRGNEEA